MTGLSSLRKNTSPSTFLDSDHSSGKFSIESIVSIIGELSLAIAQIHDETTQSQAIATDTLVSSKETERLISNLGSAASNIGSIIGIIESIASQTNMLGLNASIEAARAGDQGKGFAVVAGEVKALANQTSRATESIRPNIDSVQNICSEVAKSLATLKTSIEKVESCSASIEQGTQNHALLLSHMQSEANKVASRFKEQERVRLENISLNIVQLIVRNLYERTADVRWWATDETFVQVLEKRMMRAESSEMIVHAKQRLELINRFYSVYMNLILVDNDGIAIACSNDSFAESIVGKNLSKEEWIRKAFVTKSGDNYFAQKIGFDPLHNGRAVSVFSTSVRKNGLVDGEPRGVLGVVFDWETQAKTIVSDEPSLTDEEWERSRVMLLDRQYRIIGDSSGKPSLEVYSLKHNDNPRGSYYEADGTLVAFAKTLGYQEFDGQGWYGVVLQKNSDQC